MGASEHCKGRVYSVPGPIFGGVCIRLLMAGQGRHSEHIIVCLNGVLDISEYCQDLGRGNAESDHAGRGKKREYECTVAGGSANKGGFWEVVAIDENLPSVHDVPKQR